MTAPGESTFAGVLWLRVRSEIGTWIAMVWTL